MHSKYIVVLTHLLPRKYKMHGVQLIASLVANPLTSKPFLLPFNKASVYLLNWSFKIRMELFLSLRLVDRVE
jgi:hypothetical protein